jgi:ATP-dependent DNA helicase RecG
VRGLHAEDLVSFANTSAGGVILVGVVEELGPNGRQTPKLFGCRTGDNEKLQIVNKAQECIPPVHVEVFEEHLGEVAFFRVDVLAGAVRPHCTSGGVYKVRADGRNRVLRPDEIAAILLERESESFRTRFADATQSLARSLKQVVGEIQGIEANLKSQLQSISSSAEHASSEASDAAWTLSSLEDSVTSIQQAADLQRRSLAQVHERLAHLLAAQAVTDPVAEREQKALKDEILEYLKANPGEASQWAAGVAVKITSQHTAKLTNDQANKAFNEAFKEFAALESPKKGTKAQAKKGSAKKRSPKGKSPPRA